MEDSERIHLKVEQGTIFVLGISSLFAFVSIAVVSLVGMNLILSGEIDILSNRLFNGSHKDKRYF